MSQEDKRIALDDADLKADIKAFIDYYESENGVRLQLTQATGMLIRAGIGTMRGEKTARRMQDKQNRGRLRKNG